MYVKGLPNRALNCAKSCAALVLGLPDYGLSEGCWADLVVFPVENRACALLEGPMPRFVIKRGVLVARDGELTDAVPTCPE